MSNFYRSIAAQALAPIEQFGTPCTLFRVSDSYNVITGEVDRQTQAHESTILLLNRSSINSLSAPEFTEENLRKMKFAGLSPAASFPEGVKPETGDIIRINDLDYVILEVATLQPGGVPILHKIAVTGNSSGFTYPVITSNQWDDSLSWQDINTWSEYV